MNVSHYDFNGYYTHTSELDESDKCQITGDWLIPAGATEIEPTLKDGYFSKFNGNEWVYEKIPTTEEKKVAGILTLEEGEKIENGDVILVTSPGEFYSWNYEAFEWFYDESKKQDKISEINQKAYNEIVEKYPLWKQANITRMKDYNEVTLAEYNAMITFIDEVRAWADYEVMKIWDKRNGEENIQTSKEATEI